MIVRFTTAIVFGALALSGVYGQGGCCGTGSAPQANNSVQAQPDAKGVQKATIIVDNGFRPASIQVKAGKPVQLTFNTKHKGCITSVVFDSLKMKKDLTDGKKTVVSFTPKKAGTIGFACPMAMFKGTVVVK